MCCCYSRFSAYGFSIVHMVQRSIRAFHPEFYSFFRTYKCRYYCTYCCDNNKLKRVMAHSSCLIAGNGNERMHQAFSSPCSAGKLWQPLAKDLAAYFAKQSASNSVQSRSGPPIWWPNNIQSGYSCWPGCISIGHPVPALFSQRIPFLHTQSNAYSFNILSSKHTSLFDSTFP